jgi:hypothetical protein
MKMKSIFKNSQLQPVYHFDGWASSDFCRQQRRAEGTDALRIFRNEKGPPQFFQQQDAQAGIFCHAAGEYNITS